MEFENAFSFEPKTLADYVFLFGGVVGPVQFSKASLAPLGVTLKVASVDEETHTIYLEGCNG